MGYNNYNGYGNTPFLPQNSPVVPQMPYGQVNTQPMVNNGYNQPINGTQAQPMVNMPNKIYVTSVQDALSRFSSPNTTLSYTTQDEKFDIEVFTDLQGKKTYQMFERKPYNYNSANQTNEQSNNYVTKDYMQNLEKTINDKLSEFAQQITKTNDTIKAFNYPDMRGYATLSDIDGLREDFSKSINTLKTKIGAK